MTSQTPPRVIFSAALLKVASRCNLNCDYCYVYQHADSSWRTQPKLIAPHTVDLFASRLDEYLRSEHLDRFSIIFHGGEPLLYTAEGLARIAAAVRARVGTERELDFSLQTNGVLLSGAAIRVLADAQIGVSLSLDGPRTVHDRHRLDHAGESTFDATLGALDRLSMDAPEIFSGVIAVVDPSVPPRELFEFFAPLNLPRLDFLLPDATHTVPPAGRAEDENLYRRWLDEALRLWFLEYPNLPVRWFDALLGSRLGVPSPTDVMGLGSVSLVVVETDGSYTDHDVFKIVSDSGAKLGASLATESFADVARSPKIGEHAFRLTFDGLAAECKSCPVVEACGGGSVMHRAHPERGLDAPTTYCREMFGVLEAATQLLRESLPEPAEVEDGRLASSGAERVDQCANWRRATEERADARAAALGIERAEASAAAILLPGAYGESRAPHAGMGEPLTHWLGTVRIQAADPRLLEPFLDSIRLPPPDSPAIRHALDSLAQVEACLRTLDPHLPNAVATLISDILIVESTVPDEGGIFSFSDDKAPNVLYIAAFAGGKPIKIEDLADSIYHEFRHQVLYHYERGGALLFDHVYPRFPAPWRPGLRQSGGFLHGTYVFTGLAQYWAALADGNVPGVDRAKARRNAARAAEQAAHGIRCLRQFALLTERGQSLVDTLATEIGMTDGRLEAPGVLPLVATA